MLLPKEVNEEGEEEDPRQELVEQLLQYKMYKYMSYELRDRQVDGEKLFYKGATIPDEVKEYEEPVDLDTLLDGLTLTKLNDIFQKIIERPMLQKVAEDSEGNEFAELSIEFGDFFGLSLRGTFNENDSFEMSYYYPYFCGNKISTTEQIDIEKHAEKESYAGICDEVRLGVTLIFYLQNVADYLAVKNNKFYMSQANGTVLAALSTEGKILLPINKDEHKQKLTEQTMNERNGLIAAARKGDEDAIENLTLEDIDTYSLLSRRVQHEDILSIVDSYFMPYGIESDQYSILGEIMDCRLLQNSYTEENVYAIDIKCNDVEFPICINQKDLIGEPTVGRRFKGNIDGE